MPVNQGGGSRARGFAAELRNESEFRIRPGLVQSKPDSAVSPALARLAFHDLDSLEPWSLALEVLAVFPSKAN